MVLSSIIFVEVEFDQVALLHWLASHRVFAMFSQKRHNVQQVENDSIRCTVRISKRSHTNVAVIKGQFYKLLMLLYTLSIYIFASPICNHLLVRDPHFVLVVTSLAHFQF